MAKRSEMTAPPTAESIFSLPRVGLPEGIQGEVYLDVMDSLTTHWGEERGMFGRRTTVIERSKYEMESMSRAIYRIKQRGLEYSLQSRFTIGEINQLIRTDRVGLVAENIFEKTGGREILSDVKAFPEGFIITWPRFENLVEAVRHKDNPAVKPFKDLAEVVHSLELGGPQFYEFSPKVLQNIVKGFFNSEESDDPFFRNRYTDVQERQIQDKATVGLPMVKVSALDYALHTGVITPERYKKEKAKVKKRQSKVATHVTLRGHSREAGAGAIDEWTTSVLATEGLAKIVEDLAREDEDGRERDLQETIVCAVSPFQTVGYGPDPKLLAFIDKHPSMKGMTWLQIQTAIIQEALVDQNIIPLEDSLAEGRNPLHAYHIYGDSMGGAEAAELAHLYEGKPTSETLNALLGLHPNRPLSIAELVLRNPVGYDFGDFNCYISDEQGVEAWRDPVGTMNDKRHELMSQLGKVKEGKEAANKACMELCEKELRRRALGSYTRPANCGKVRIVIGENDPLANHTNLRQSTFLGLIPWSANVTRADRETTERAYSGGKQRQDTIEFIKEATHNLPISSVVSLDNLVEHIQSILNYLRGEPLVVSVDIMDRTSTRSHLVSGPTLMEFTIDPGIVAAQAAGARRRLEERRKEAEARDRQFAS